MGWFSWEQLITWSRPRTTTITNQLLALAKRCGTKCIRKGCWFGNRTLPGSDGETQKLSLHLLLIPYWYGQKNGFFVRRNWEKRETHTGPCMLGPRAWSSDFQPCLKVKKGLPTQFAAILLGDGWPYHVAKHHTCTVRCRSLVLCEGVTAIGQGMFSKAAWHSSQRTMLN